MSHKRIRMALAAAALCFACTGLAAIAKPAWRAARRVILHHQAKSLWQDALDTPSCEDGSPIAWLSVPDANIDVLVIQGVTEWSLHQFPCMMKNTGIPVILAHRDTHFRGLKKIVPGSTVSLQLRNSSIQTYTVMETEVLTPEQVQKRLYEKSDDDWLVLLTCYPFRYTGAAPNRFLAWAKSTGS